MAPEIERLTDAIQDATRKAVTDLFFETGERFYYISLITTGEGHFPCLSAWSFEQLAKLPESDRSMLKWSYADSPYCAYGHAHFEGVKALFEERLPPDPMSDGDAQMEYDLRLTAMEQALRRLDQEGLFGAGEARQRLLINAEVMPPDHTNTARAKRLNTGRVLFEWLEEAAE